MWNFFRNIRLNFSLNGESLLIKRGDTQSLTLLEITCKNNAGNFIGRLIKTNAQLRNADVSRYKHECSGRYTLIRSVARIPSLPESPPAHPPLSATPVATYSRTRFPALPAAGRPPPFLFPSPTIPRERDECEEDNARRCVRQIELEKCPFLDAAVQSSTLSPRDSSVPLAYVKFRMKNSRARTRK